MEKDKKPLINYEGIALELQLEHKDIATQNGQIVNKIRYLARMLDIEVESAYDTLLEEVRKLNTNKNT